MGFVLKDHQFLFGSAVSQVVPTTMGQVTIPPFSQAMPTMTNSLGNNGIELASYNTVSGIHVAYPGGNCAAIHGDHLTDATIINNLITGISNNAFGAFGGIGFGTVSTGTISGTLTIANNTLSSTGTLGTVGIDIEALSSSSPITTFISNNIFSNFYLAINHNVADQNTSNLNITDNLFQNGVLNGEAIFVDPLGNSTLTVAITNNQFLNNHFSKYLDLETSGNGTLTAVISSNLFDPVSQTGNIVLSVLPSSTFQAVVTASNNTFIGRNLINSGINIGSSPSLGPWTVTAENNTFSEFIVNPIVVSAQNTTQSAILNLVSNQISGSGAEAIHLADGQPMVGTILSNTISQTNVGFNSILVTTTLATSNLCLTVNSNQADRPIQLTRTAGTFNLEASVFITNTPTPTLTDTINIVFDGTCSP